VLSVNATKIDAAPTAADYTIEITSNVAWTATSAETWCSVSPTSGSGSGVLTLAVAENTSIATRTATVTVKAGDLNCDIIVIQTSVHTAPAVVFTSDRQLITFLASAQKLIVNWGDGEISEYNNLRYGTYISYSYLTATTHTIQIYEEKLTALNLSGLDLTNLDVNCSELTELYCSSNQLTSLDVSKNPKLTKIDCSSNQLTSLNINGCTKLGEIPYYYSVVSIDDNQLSAAALNEIFTALPVITSNNIISVGDNPGTSTCNKSIAINKGWRINDGY
jgi:Leucine-rich repeat (LRR) protein